MPGGSNVLEKVIDAGVNAAASADRKSREGSRPGRLPLDGLPGYLSTEAEQLLIGISVYREPADRNAVLFQVGLRDWTAARAPDRQGPVPPYLPPADLAETLAVCEASGMCIVAGGSAGAAGADDGRTVFVEAWLASELHRMLAAAGRDGDLTHAHRLAAEYWQWRSAAWPQGRRADLHDLLEARHHLFDAGDSEQASALTDAVCAQLHAWGDLGREAALIHETLDRLPACSAGRAGWIHELGRIAEVRTDYADAERRYQQALDMYAVVGDRAGVSRSYHSLGILAQAQGDYAGAERRYQQSAEAADDIAARVNVAAAAAPHEAQALADSPAPLTSSPPTDTPRRADASRPADAGNRIGRGAAAVSGHRHRAHWAPSVRLPVLAVAVLAMAALSAVQIDGVFTAPPASHSPAVRTGTIRASAAAMVRLRTANWVKHRVSQTAIVACDPAMCSTLQAQGVPAGSLLTLGPGGSADPLGSNVVVATAAVRSLFGARLASVYAPVPIASFGAGSARIEVRVVAPDGSAAYLSVLRSDLLARRSAGAQLLLNTRITVTGAARRQLTEGLADSRLLTTLAVLARMDPLRIIGFSGRSPGASGAVPLPAVEISGSAPGKGGKDGKGNSYLKTFVNFLRAQRAPFLAASVRPERLSNGQPAVRIEFAYPGPLGLLSAGASALSITNRK
jgi:Tetratricopeptide repeat